MLPKRAFSFALTALAAAGAPAVAQPLANGALAEEALFGGAVVFRGDGAITDRSTGSDGSAAFRFWRPVLYPAEPWPVAGRMDCDISARDEAFTPELFDVQARYEAVKDRREHAGLRDRDVRADFTEQERRLDISGHRYKPLRNYVLSHIVRRDGGRLYDIRMECTFAKGDGAGKPDFAALVHSYTSFSFGEGTINPAGDTKS